MSRCLIVNADDFGYTPGVTRGIIEGHRKGIVTSTSIMINMPFAAEAVKLAHREVPELGLGLHLTLTAGPPISQPDAIPDLIQADNTFRHKHEVFNSLTTIDLLQIESELRGQIARFNTLVGHLPDHLDSHHHITYLNPLINGLMIQLAQELGVPIRKPLPTNLAAAKAFLLGTNPDHNLLPNGETIEILARSFEKTRVLTPDYFIADFFGKGATLGNLLNLLIHLPEGISELMCHPAEVDEALRMTSSYTDRRAEELAALTHQTVREIIQAEGVELNTFRVIT